MKKKIFYLAIVTLILVTTLFTLTGCSNNTKNENASDKNISGTSQKSKLTPKRDFENSKNWGFIDENNNWIIEPKYKSASDFSNNGMALVQLVDTQKYGYINEQDEFVLQADYILAQPFSNEGYAGVTTDDKVVIINSKGEFVCTFDDAWYAAFCEGTNLVKVVKDKFTDRSYAFYDLEKNQITEYKYWEQNIGGITVSCNKGYIEVGIRQIDTNSMLYGLLDKSGKEVIECKYQSMTYYDDEQLWLVEDVNGKYYINEKGEKVKDW